MVIASVGPFGRCSRVDVDVLQPDQVEDDMQKKLGSFLLGMGLDANSEPSLPSVNLGSVR